MNQKIINIVLVGAVIVLGIVGYLAWVKKSEPVSPDQVSQTFDWITYTNNDVGFEFKYPPNLILGETQGEVTLSHSIPYENSGDCDMEGGTKVYKTLNDFGLSFEIVKGKAGPVGWEEGQFDGPYNLNQLKGNWAFEGLEGCGYTGYYFPLENGTTLVVKKDSIQALQGYSWNTNEILKIPNVINLEENEEIFKQILSTFKFTK